MLAILLAAGRGQRLGQQKALIELGGTRALDRCVRALAYGGADRVRVVLGSDAADIRDTVDLSGVEVVVNEQSGRGQTSSLKLALGSDVDADGFMIHTVDHPLVEARDVARLVSCWRDRKPPISIVVPSVGDRRGHPALFAAELADAFGALLDDQPAHAVVRAHPERVLHVPMTNPWIVRDIDTPDDLAAAQEATTPAL